MADIFISYGRADRPHAERIASVLEQNGWSVWWDRKLLAGDTFEHTIQHALNEARCIVVLWSAGSVTSSWVKDEATEGKRRNALVPVLIDEVEMPLGFRQLHAVTLLDAASEQDLSRFDDLVASVDNVLRRSASAATPEGSQAAGAPLESSPRSASSSIEAMPSRRATNADRSLGTVPRSYLYAALGLVVIVALIAVWERFDSGARFGTAGTPPTEAAGATSSSGSSPVSEPSPTVPKPVTAGQAAPSNSTREAVAGVAGVVVSGTGQGFYYVFDASGAEQLASSLTNHPIDLFPGDYIVALQGVRRPIRIEGGRRTTLGTGRVLVPGTGGNFYYLHDATGQTQLGSSLTNGTLEAFPGDYTVVLHGVPARATVQAGRDTSVATGSMMVPGSGSSFYYVFDEKGEKQLASRLTNTAIELFPGSYTVALNQTRRSVRVVAGERIVIGQ